MYSVRIDRQLLPEEEWDAANKITDNLRSLEIRAQEFGHSFDLYMATFHGRPENRLEPYDRLKYMAWTRIAGRAGALNAYGFFLMMQEINKTKAPTLWAKADMASRKAATRLFAKEFPSIAGIRTVAAHPGETSANPTEVARHRLADVGLFMESTVRAEANGMTFSSTFEGKMVGYELSERTGEVLYAVLRKYQEAFYPLDATTADTRQWLQESERQRREAHSGRLRPWDSPDQ